MTRIEKAAIDEVGEVSPTKGKNYQLRLKLARRWMSIFASEDSLKKLKVLADEASQVDWVEFKETQDGKYTNISELQIDGQKFGKPGKKESKETGVGMPQAAPQEPYADVTVTRGRTISTAKWESIKIGFSLTIHGVPLDKIDEVKEAEEERVKLWTDHAEAQER